MELTLTTILQPHQAKNIMDPFLQDFFDRTGIKVKWRPMQWGSAWEELQTIGQGADVSQVGSTWLGSLAGKGLIHGFSREEIDHITSPNSFHPPAWNTISIMGLEHDWGIPWISDTHLLIYRKDLFDQAGIDELDAFSSGEKLLEVIERLKSIDVSFPWLQPVLVSKEYLMHIGTNWLWSANGHFLHRDGKRMLFAEPEAIRGWENFLKSYTYLDPEARHLTSTDCARLFAEGKSALMMNDVYMTHLVSSESSLEVRKNLRTAPMLNSPWFGGSNMVIWKHVEQDPDKFAAALELLSFLSSKEVQVKFCKLGQWLPARIDALEEAFPSYHILSSSLHQACKQGINYPALTYWQSIEESLSTELQNLLSEILSGSNIDLKIELQKRLKTLEKELEGAIS